MRRAERFRALREAGDIEGMFDLLRSLSFHPEDGHRDYLRFIDELYTDAPDEVRDLEMTKGVGCYTFHLDGRKVGTIGLRMNECVLEYFDGILGEGFPVRACFPHYGRVPGPDAIETFFRHIDHLIASGDYYRDSPPRHAYEEAMSACNIHQPQMWRRWE